MSVPTTAIANIQAAGSRLLRTPLAARASRAMAPISPTLLRNDRSRTVAYPNEVGSPVIAISIGDQGRRVKSVSTCPHPRSGRGESVDCPLSKTVAEDELRLPRLKAVRRLLHPGESERLASRHCYDRRSSNSGWDTGRPLRPNVSGVQVGRQRDLLRWRTGVFLPGRKRLAVTTVMLARSSKRDQHQASRPAVDELSPKLWCDPDQLAVAEFDLLSLDH